MDDIKKTFYFRHCHAPLCLDGTVPASLTLLILPRQTLAETILLVLELRAG